MIDSTTTTELVAKLATLATNAEYQAIASERAPVELAALERLAPRPHGNLLLVGTGPRSVDAASRTFECERIVALQLGSAALESARRRATATRGIEWQDALAEAPPLAAAHFDSILFAESLTLLPEPEAWLARARSALRQGGRLVVLLDFYAENTASHAWRRRFDLPYRLHSVPGWARLVAEAGFEVQEQSRIFAKAASPWRALRGSLLTLAAPR